jgi:choline dehydrogenase
VAVVGSNDEQITVKAKKEVIVSCGIFDLPKLLMISDIGPEAELAQYGIQCIVYSAPAGQHLLDHPVISHVFKLKDGYGLDGHILHAGPMCDAVITSYGKDQKGPYHNGLLELVGFPLVDDNLMTRQEYRIERERNGSIDAFASGQPHF